jgi:hypothetical protein
MTMVVKLWHHKYHSHIIPDYTKHELYYDTSIHNGKTILDDKPDTLVIKNI